MIRPSSICTVCCRAALLGDWLVIWIWNTIWSIQTLNKLFSLCFKRFKWHNIFNYTISLKLCLIFLILSIKWCQHRASRKEWYMWRFFFFVKNTVYPIILCSNPIVSCVHMYFILTCVNPLLSCVNFVLSLRCFFLKITLRVLYMFIWLCMFAFAS